MIFNKILRLENYDEKMGESNNKILTFQRDSLLLYMS